MKRRKFIKAMGMGIAGVMLPAAGIMASKGSGITGKECKEAQIAIDKLPIANSRSNNFIIDGDEYIFLSPKKEDWNKDEWREGDTISIDNKPYVIAEVFDNCLKLYKNPWVVGESVVNI